MSENKMCSYCNKLTADEIVKGDIFCIECGRQRAMIEPSPKEVKTKKRQESWKSVGGVVMLIVALAVGKTVVNIFETQRPAELKKIQRDAQRKAKDSILKLHGESLQQFADLTAKAHSAIANNLNNQDKDDFLRISSAGEKMTLDEGYRLNTLVEKSKTNMSTEDRELVERFQQQLNKLMK